MDKGLIHVYTGDGKGKTTAAFGLALRAAGHAKKVLILQFLKSRMRNTGEVKLARKAGIKVIRFRDQTSPLFDPSVKVSDLKKSVQEAINFSIEIIQSGKYDLIVMEEFNNLLFKKYTTLSALHTIMKARPEDLEIVFTGRGAPKALIEMADYATEMLMIKHPANYGIMAREGIEY